MRTQRSRMYWIEMWAFAVVSLAIVVCLLILTFGLLSINVIRS